MEDSSDPTAAIRRRQQLAINSNPREREELERLFGQVWDTTQLKQDFEVRGFMAPYVGVTRKSDGQTGGLTFQHHPRYYFLFVATGEKL